MNCEKLVELYKNMNLHSKMGKINYVVSGITNGYVGESQIGFERWHGGFSVGERNEEGEKILHLAQAFDLAIVNTFYSKRR